jgi:hypothetical protein
MLSPNQRWTRNHYATRFADARDVLRFVQSHLDVLAQGTRLFADAVWTSDLPVAVRDAAMCSLSALRSETIFRAEDGRLYGWKACDGRVWIFLNVAREAVLQIDLPKDGRVVLHDAAGRSQKLPGSDGLEAVVAGDRDDTST